MERYLASLFVFLFLTRCARTSVSSNATNDGGEALTDAAPRIDRDAACETVRVGATLAKAPVDVIVVVDNSFSMTDEVLAIQNNLNQSLAAIIEAGGLDYRVIMISRHGSATLDQSICVSAPLSGNASCSPPPARPSNSARFYHYSVEVRSTDPYAVIAQSYNAADEFYLAPNGWQAWLRPAAFKTIVLFTDDESAFPSSTLDQALLSAVPRNFGTAAARNYRFHAVVGLRENTPATKPYDPADPIVTQRCTGAMQAGAEHQGLARLTGGLRYPICQTGSYDAVFRAVATGVVTGARLACDFEVPPAPKGKVYRLPSAELEYTPSSGGAPRLLHQVGSAAGCAPDSFYLVGSHVYLCPSSCSEVSADVGARVEFLLECDVLVG